MNRLVRGNEIVHESAPGGILPPGNNSERHGMGQIFRRQAEVCEDTNRFDIMPDKQKKLVCSVISVPSVDACFWVDLN